MHYRIGALLIGLFSALCGSAKAQDTGPYIQVSPTPSKLSVGGPGFVQIDANGIASIAAAAPGSGNVTAGSALLLNHMVVGNGGSDIKTLGGTVGGAFTTAGAFTTTGAVSGVTLAFPSGGPFTYTFPLATATLASLAGSETFTNKIYSGGQFSGSFSGNPTFLGIPLFTNLSTGTQTVCLGLNSTFQLVTLSGSCLSASLADQNITGGANITSLTQSAGNITVDCGLRPAQYIANSGAFTITAPSNDGYCYLDVENGASAGAVSVSGFSPNTIGGASLTTTNGNNFRLYISRVHGHATIDAKALQ